MKKVSIQLIVLFTAQIVLTLVAMVLFECDLLPVGVMAHDKRSEFVLTTLMEILSLGAAFMGLRLFKFGVVHNDIVNRKEPAMWKWGMTRLLILQAPMLIDTLLYYIYMNPTFGYLAIMLALCLPFVYPSINRCETDTTSVEEQSE